MKRPAYQLTDPLFDYTPADATDIRKRFRAEGLQTRDERIEEERLEAAKRVIKRLMKGTERP